jgi:hypothetical protein
MVFDDRTRPEPTDRPDPPENATVIDDGELAGKVARQLRALRRELSRPATADVEKTSLADAPSFEEVTPYESDNGHPPTMLDASPTFDGVVAWSDDAPTSFEQRAFDDVDAPTSYDMPVVGRVVSPPPADAAEGGPLGFLSSLESQEIAPVSRRGPAPVLAREKTSVDFSYDDLGAVEPSQEVEPVDEETLPEDAVLSPIVRAAFVEDPDFDPDAKLAEPPLPPKLEISSVEYTRKEPIPMDLFFDGGGPTAEDFPESARPASRAAKSQARDAPQGRQETLLDAAAQIGVAPEPRLESLPHEAPTDEPSLEDPFPEPKNLDLDPFLEERPAQRKAPSAGVAALDIHRLAEGAATTAKIIPVILGLFVVLATLMISISLFRTQTPKTEHVELRFLEAVGEVPTTTEGGVRVMIETLPPDLLVVHDRQILGKTPLTIDLPIAVGNSVGVELKGPYYEDWIGHVQKSPAGELEIRAELIRK